MLSKEMLGKVCIVTGANSGIGKVIAEEIANKSATLIMVCRNRDKPKVAYNDIIGKTKNPNVELMIADISLQKEVRELADKIKEKYPVIDVLINNAGCMSFGYEETSEGIEKTFATNHLASFLLTNLLIENIKKSKEARIINVASEASKTGKINFEDINLKNDYSAFKAYSQSKLANIIFTYELARRLKEYKNISINCVHPGNIPNTKLGQGSKAFANYIKTIPKSLILTPEQGAETTIWLACSEEARCINGGYFYKKNQIRSNPISYDLEIGETLWDLSIKMTGV